MRRRPKKQLLQTSKIIIMNKQSQAKATATPATDCLNYKLRLHWTAPSSTYPYGTNKLNNRASFNRVANTLNNCQVKAKQPIGIQIGKQRN